MKYQQTFDECLSRISGVCEGCGGKLEPIETVDNSGNPTFWCGCIKCSCFHSGVDAKYWKVARELIEKDIVYPYHHLRIERENLDKEYYLDAQTAGLSHIIAQIDTMLKAAGQKRTPQDLKKIIGSIPDMPEYEKQDPYKEGYLAGRREQARVDWVAVEKLQRGGCYHFHVDEILTTLSANAPEDK